MGPVFFELRVEELTDPSALERAQRSMSSAPFPATTAAAVKVLKDEAAPKKATRKTASKAKASATKKATKKVAAKKAAKGEDDDTDSAAPTKKGTRGKATTRKAEKPETKKPTKAKAAKTPKKVKAMGGESSDSESLSGDDFLMSFLDL